MLQEREQEAASLASARDAALADAAAARSSTGAAAAEAGRKAVEAAASALRERDAANKQRDSAAKQRDEAVKQRDAAKKDAAAALERAEWAEAAASAARGQAEVAGSAAQRKAEAEACVLPHSYFNISLIPQNRGVCCPQADGGGWKCGAVEGGSRSAPSPSHAIAPSSKFSKSRPLRPAGRRRSQATLPSGRRKQKHVTLLSYLALLYNAFVQCKALSECPNSACRGYFQHV